MGAAPPGPRTPEGGLQGEHKHGAGRGGPSSLTLSSHGAAGGCRDTHQGPELRSNSLAETERKKNPHNCPPNMEGRLTTGPLTLPPQHWRRGLGLRRPRHPRQHPGDHSVESPTPGRNLCTARLAAWMGPHPQPRGHSGGIKTESHLATSVTTTRPGVQGTSVPAGRLLQDLRYATFTEGPGTGHPPPAAAHPQDPAGPTSRKSKYTRGVQVGKKRRSPCRRRGCPQRNSRPTKQLPALRGWGRPSLLEGPQLPAARVACSINLLSLVRRKQLRREDLTRSQDTKVYQKRHLQDSPGGPVVKNLPANTGDAGSTLGLGGQHVSRGG